MSAALRHVQTLDSARQQHRNAARHADNIRRQMLMNLALNHRAELRQPDRDAWVDTGGGLVPFHTQYPSAMMNGPHNLIVAPIAPDLRSHGVKVFRAVHNVNVRNRNAHGQAGKDVLASMHSPMVELALASSRGRQRGATRTGRSRRRRR